MDPMGYQPTSNLKNSIRYPQHSATQKFAITQSPFQTQDFLLPHPPAKEKELNEFIAGPHRGIHSLELFAIDL